MLRAFLGTIDRVSGVRATKWKYLHDQKRCPGFVQIRWSHEDSLNILEPQQNLNEIYWFCEIKNVTIWKIQKNLPRIQLSKAKLLKWDPNSEISYSDKILLLLELHVSWRATVSECWIKKMDSWHRNQVCFWNFTKMFFW